jgi:25S rRNA (cytosine2870-C5)-methyltransferase
MEARARKMEARAAKESAADLEEMQLNDAGEELDELDGADDGGDEDGFHLPNADEREEEKQAGGPDVQTVQRRMRECVRVLGNFAKRGAKERSRSEYVEQLILDIANYYGYNEFLAEKLFSLFPVAEVSRGSFQSGSVEIS